MNENPKPRRKRGEGTILEPNRTRGCSDPNRRKPERLFESLAQARKIFFYICRLQMVTFRI